MGHRAVRIALPMLALFIANAQDSTAPRTTEVRDPKIFERYEGQVAQTLDLSGVRTIFQNSQESPDVNSLISRSVPPHLMMQIPMATTSPPP